MIIIIKVGQIRHRLECSLPNRKRPRLRSGTSDSLCEQRGQDSDRTNQRCNVARGCCPTKKDSNGCDEEDPKPSAAPEEHYISEVDDEPTPTQKSTNKIHATALPSNRTPPNKIRRLHPSDSVACDESEGFCVYNLQGGGVKFVIADPDEMDDVFSHVLKLAATTKAKEKAKKNRAARKQERQEAAKTNRAARQTLRSHKSKSTNPTMPDVVHIDSPPTTIPTHNRSTRIQPTTEYASIPYSYGELDWDSLNRCWKPSSHPKVQSRSSRRNSGRHC
jgi:hypothetical protein